MFKRYNGILGTLASANVTSGALTPLDTSFNSIPTVAAPDIIRIEFEPDTANFEVAYVMANTTGSGQPTLWRGREGTTAKAHALGTVWHHGASAREMQKSPFYDMPSDWDEHLLQAMYAGNVNVGFLGMSIQHGQQSTNWVTKSYPGLFKTRMITTRGYPLRGDYYPVTFSPQFNPFVTPPTTLPWAMTLNAVFLSGGPNFVGVCNAGNNPTWSFTSPDNCTQMEIIYWDFNGNGTTTTFSWNVDGGATQNTVVGSTNVQKRLTGGVLSGLAGGATHTINFTAQTNTGAYISIAGVCVYPTGSGTTGWAFARYGATGGTMMNLLRGDLTPPDKLVAYQGNTATAPGPYNTGFGFPMQPDLSIVELGGNDAADPGVNGSALGASLTQMKDGWQRYIDATRRGQTNASGIFVAVSVPGPESGSSDFRGSSIDNPKNWPFYVMAMREKAYENQWAFLNIHYKWGMTPVTQGYCTATDFHPTDAGHADYDTLLGEMIPI